MRLPAVMLAILALFSNSSFAASSIDVREVGHGTALVFLPALGCPGDLWDGVAGQLASDHTCFVVTLACHGAPCAGNTFDTNQVIEDLVDFFQSKKLERPTLIGHSFGGHLALRLAASHPDVFAALIIVDALPFPLGFANPSATPEQAAQQAAMFRAMIERQDDAAFEKQQTAMLQGGVTDTVRLAQIVRWQVQSDRGALARSFQEMLGTDLRDSIATIRARTLVLGTWRAAEPLGMTAVTARERFTEQYAKLPDCTIVIAERARHFLMYDDPAWLVEKIRNFGADSR